MQAVAFIVEHYNGIKSSGPDLFNSNFAKAADWMGQVEPGENGQEGWCVR
jgi:hypothetical protein